MAQDRDDDSASASWESQSNVPAHADASAPHHRQKHHGNHQKHHHVGRAHARVPSAKVSHKNHQHAHAGTRVNRRAASPEREHQQRPSAHRRATSDGRFSRDSSSGTLLKSSSSAQLKRNRSHVEVAKRNRSTDKLKRTSSGTGINRTQHKPNKSQVHFDLGLEDEEEDEWVDASGSNSPYLSRKGSLNSSAQSSLRPGSIPATAGALPSRPTSVPSNLHSTATTPEERERTQHKEYLTSRVLQRTPSHGAPPQMTADIAQADMPKQSPDSTDRESSPSKADSDGLISRFVEGPSSALTSEGSFYQRPPTELSRVKESEPRRVQSMSGFTQAHEAASNGVDESVLVPQTARRAAGPGAQTSRTQQKLNLQRASSVIEPTQPVSNAVGTNGASPWIGVGGPGYDGGTSRDPRVGKLLEKTGMEYLVVRRYQNPVARSLNRLGRLPNIDGSRRLPRPSSVITNGKRTPEPAGKHSRNVSMPDPRQTAPTRRVASLRLNGAGSGYEDDDVTRLSERLSGTSLVGDEEDETLTTLRNMWERPLELTASTE